MSLLPIVLFSLGVVFLFLAFRMGNSNATSPEILATLKGLAGVKRELSQLQKGLREAEAQMGDHELRLMRNENVQVELRSAIQTQAQERISNPDNSKNSNNSSILDSLASYKPQSQPFHPMAQPTSPSNSTSSVSLGNYPKSQVLPEKYRWVLELHDQGWSVAEIAGHLAVSRDAVNMVLRTSQKGGCA